MATTYRYLFVDLLSNTIIGELPLTGVGFTQQLNQPGTFQGHLLLSGVNADKYNVELSTIPAHCGLYVDRDGILVWGGVIWGRSYSSASQTLTFSAQEWISYFDHRRVTQDVQFTNIDQLVIAKTLIEDAQNATYGDIGVGYNSAGQTTSGVLVNRTYYNYELKNVFQAVQDLSRQGDGFDFSIDVEYDGITGLPVKNFNTYYPRSGVAYSFGDPNENFNNLDLSKKNILQFPDNYENHYKVACLIGPDPVWKKELHDKAGYFNQEEYSIIGDWEMWARFAKAGAKFKLIPEVLAIYLDHPNTVSKESEDKLEQQKVKLYKAFESEY